MNVTVKTLAQAAGVSRGTVDRVLHDRGSVRPEVASKIKALAKQMGYVPNRVGRALASTYHDRYKIGALVPSIGNVFFDRVIDGIDQAHREFSDLGVDVIIKKIQGYEVKSHLRAIDSLIDCGCKALCLATVNTQEIREKLLECKNNGIKIILFNTDVENCGRLCYIGSDYIRAGRTCAGMLALISKEEKLHILIVTGSRLHLGQNMRIKGFEDELKSIKVNYEISAVVESNDSDIQSQQVTSEMLKSNKEINCVYVTGAGVQGVGAALIANNNPNIIAIAYDDIYTTVELVNAGIIKFVICQQPQRQGYHAVKRAYQALSGAVNDHNFADFYTDTLIKISSNIG